MGVGAASLLGIIDVDLDIIPKICVLRIAVACLRVEGMVGEMLEVLMEEEEEDEEAMMYHDPIEIESEDEDGIDGD